MKSRLPVNQAALDVDLVGGVPVFLRRSGQLANPGRQPAQPTVAGRRNVPIAGVRGGRIDALVRLLRPTSAQPGSFELDKSTPGRR